MKSRPAGTRGTYSSITSTMSTLASRSSMKGLGMGPGICPPSSCRATNLPKCKRSTGVPRSLSLLARRRWELPKLPLLRTTRGRGKPRQWMPAPREGRERASTQDNKSRGVSIQTHPSGRGIPAQCAEPAHPCVPLYVRVASRRVVSMRSQQSSGGSEPLQADPSFSRTVVLSCFMSARPRTRGLSHAMTRPMSFIDPAPVSASASAISARSACGLRGEGM